MTERLNGAEPGTQLLLRRFGEQGPAVLMVHGLGDTGDVFCPGGDQGLAPWLAGCGYSVHVADLPTRAAAFGQHAPSLQDLITQQIPALLQQVTEQHPGERLFIVTHGWGGVLTAATLIHHPRWIARVEGLVQLAVRRTCQQHGWRRRLLLDWMWGRLAPLLGRRQGTLALRALGLGRVDIARQLHDEVLMWQNDAKWRDPHDDFDYAAALDGIRWPDSLYMAGRDDHYMGYVADIRAFARELGPHDAQLVVLQEGAGSSRSYGHRDLLTHPQAVEDHFPLILSWMRSRTSPVESPGEAVH